MHEGRVGDAEDEMAESEPTTDEFDVFEFGVGDPEELHLALSASEDVAFESPADFDLLRKETKLSNDLVPSEGISRRDGEVDVDGIVFEHG